MAHGNHFNRNWRTWQIIAGTEIRVRVSATRVRIPDVCVLRRSDPADPVVLVAPLICVEVLSPDDTLRSQRDRVDDYLAMGVEHIWLIDPVSREAWIATPTGYDANLSGEFTVPERRSVSPSPKYSLNWTRCKRRANPNSQESGCPMSRF